MRGQRGLWPTAGPGLETAVTYQLLGALLGTAEAPRDSYGATWALEKTLPLKAYSRSSPRHPVPAARPQCWGVRDLQLSRLRGLLTV